VGTLSENLSKERRGELLELSERTSTTTQSAMDNESNRKKENGK